jgi:hypothetical protein
MHAPREDKGGDGAAAGGERGAEAEAPGDGGDDELLEQEHEEGGDAVHRGGVGVVEAVGALVVLVRHHLPLHPATSYKRDLSGGRGATGRKRRGGTHGAAAALCADGEEEREDAEDGEDDAEEDGGGARGPEAAHRSRGPAAVAAVGVGDRAERPSLCSSGSGAEMGVNVRGARSSATDNINTRFEAAACCADSHFSAFSTLFFLLSAISFFKKWYLHDINQKFQGYKVLFGFFRD